MRGAAEWSPIFYEELNKVEISDGNHRTPHYAWDFKAGGQHMIEVNDGPSDLALAALNAQPPKHTFFGMIESNKKLDIARLSERLMSMADATWARHINPWSGWSRITILPFFSFAIWSRIWLGWNATWLIMIGVIWTWINPRLFAPPLHNGAWMTRAVLGERIWLARNSIPIPEHHGRVCSLLTLGAVIGVLVLIYGLWQLELGWIVSGLAVAMGAKLWFLDRMVWLLADVE